MTITSTYDHRIIQGAESGAFLRRIDGCSCAARTASTTRCSRPSERELQAAPTQAGGAPAAGARHRRGRAATAGEGAEREDLRGAGRGGRAGAGLSVLRPPGRTARPAGLAADRRPRARPRAARADPRRDGRDPGRPAAHRRARRHAGRGAAQPAGHLLRLHRLRGRAHRLARGAGLAAPGDRVRRAPPAAGRGPSSARCCSG